MNAQYPSQLTPKNCKMAKINFEEALEKVKNGVCCIPGCNKPTELELSPICRDCPPIFCEEHLLNGELTHVGNYVYKSTYYNEWTCCHSSWKLSKCPKFSVLFVPYQNEIPITDYHHTSLETRLAIHNEREEENRRLEAMYNAGHDEYYDRS